MRILLLVVLGSSVLVAPIGAQEVGVAAPASARDQVRALEQQRGRLGAMRALIAMGKDAVPELERVIESANEGTATPALPHVLACLAAIGPEAVTAQPLLRRYLKQGAIEHLLAAMTAYADLAAYAPLMEQVAAGRYVDDTTLVNQARIRLLREVGKQEVAGLQVLARTQEIKANQRVRALTEHGDPNDVAVLVSIIENKLWFQRDVAAEQLGRMGAAARAALMPLAVALADIHDPGAGMPDRIRRQKVLLRDDFGSRAAEAILRIDPKSPCAAAANAFVIGHAEDPRARVDALAGLVAVPGDTDRVLPILIGWLDQPAVHAEVFNALGAMGARAVAAVPVLEKIVSAERQPDARLAKVALRQIRAK